MFNCLDLIHAVSHLCGIKNLVSHTCVIQDLMSELLFCASLRFFGCDFQQYADVPRNKITTEYKAKNVFYLMKYKI